MNILVISAHPDDETIGMGGTICKLKEQGHKLSWMVITRAFSPKWSKKIISQKLGEVEKVSKFYGFNLTRQCSFKTASLAMYPQHKVVDEIVKILDKTKSEVVYTSPLLDTHQDHEIVAKATLLACRPQNVKTIGRIFSYEIVVGTGIAKLAQRVGKYNYFENISDYLPRKLEAMNIYKTEVKKLPHPRSSAGLKILARERGLVCGFGYAEAFELLFAREN